jgi:hypothetical protein
VFIGPLVAETVGVSSATRIFAGLDGTIWAGADVGGCDVTLTSEPAMLEETGPDWTEMLTSLTVLISLIVLSCCVGVVGFGDDGLIWTGFPADGGTVEDCSGRSTLPLNSWSCRLEAVGLPCGPCSSPAAGPDSCT